MIQNKRPYQWIADKTGSSALALAAAWTAKACGAAAFSVCSLLPAVRHGDLPQPDAAREALQAACPKPVPDTQWVPLPPLDAKVDLSVIVPAYNAQDTLETCLQSILAQKTRYNIQIVVIDSNSTDGTSAILQKYRAMPQVTVGSIHGLRSAARARNEGLRYAVGRYLMFVDSDDLLLPHAVQTLLDAAVQMDADLVQGGWQYLFADGQHGPVQTYARQRYTGPLALDRLDLPGMPWGKVYRRELFAQIRFPANYSCFEDSILHFLVLRLAKAPASVPQTVYLWRKNPEGITARCQNQPVAVQSYWVMEELLTQDAALGLPHDELFCASLALQLGNFCYATLAHTSLPLQKAVFRLCSELYSTAVPPELDPPHPYAARCAAAALRKRRFALWQCQGRIFLLL